MDNDDSSAELDQPLSGTESSLTRGGIAPGESKPTPDESGHSRQSTNEPAQVKIVVQVVPATTQPGEPSGTVAQGRTAPVGEAAALPASESAREPIANRKAESENQPIPA